MSLRHYNMCECIVAVNALQLLHERNIKRATFASRCRALKFENS